jgi:Lipase (class 3)
MTTTTPTAGPEPEPVTTSIYQTFHLKTDDSNSNPTDDGNKRQGRAYSTKYSRQPGGLRVEDMIFGVKMAHLSSTDDSVDRLKTSGANVIATIEEIVGKDDARLSLTELLKKHFDLTMDCWIDESGFRKGRPVDTQGFIASNDDIIVLSYRFSTTKLDWLTNLSMATSEWEPDRDEVIGHAGWCSTCDGLFTKYCTKRGKPRVHTGFYNNFLYTIPMIRKHILAKLQNTNTTSANNKPIKVYICGCSLGAAIATVAFCFLLQEMMPILENPNSISHKLINVTAGSPRVCDALMKQQVMAKMKTLRPLDRAVICRLVYNHDLVPHIPVDIAGFVHLDKLVYITRDGEAVLINPRLEKSTRFDEIKELYDRFNTILKFNREVAAKEKEKNKGDDQKHEAAADEESGKTPFELECEKAPGPIKDHMTYWYLTCLQKLKVKVDAGLV